jgi:ATP synthase protein I
MSPSGSDDEQERGSRSWMKDAGPFLTLGMQLAVAVVAFFFLGRWLDGVFGTEPWLTVIGVVLGMAGGFTSFIRTAMELGRREDRKAHDRREGGGRAED